MIHYLDLKNSTWVESEFLHVIPSYFHSRTFSELTVESPLCLAGRRPYHNKIFTFSCSWVESLIFQLLIFKVNEKAQFFSSNFALMTKGYITKHNWRLLGEGWSIKVIYTTLTIFERLVTLKHFCITLV